MAHFVEKISSAVTEELWLYMVVHVIKEMPLLMMNSLNVFVVYHCTHFDAVIIVVQVPSRRMALFYTEKNDNCLAFHFIPPLRGPLVGQACFYPKIFEAEACTQVICKSFLPVRAS